MIKDKSREINRLYKDEGITVIKILIFLLILCICLWCVSLVSCSLPDIIKNTAQETDIEHVMEDTIKTGGNPLGLLTIGAGLLLGWYKRKAIINGFKGGWYGTGNSGDKKSGRKS